MAPEADFFNHYCQTHQVPPGLHPISEECNLRLDHPQIPDYIPSTPNDCDQALMASLKCCCGRLNCAYLEHNNAALGGLERDLETAARLGQALLNRHESYVKESQAEHARLSTYVTDLEGERSVLQNANERIVAENRELLAKLESLNTNLVSSDTHVKKLEDLLRDCEAEVNRLNCLVLKAEELEDKVREMERERLELDELLEDNRTQTRSTLSRWRESERKVRQLEDEVHKIEWEAKLDRERHEELVARMERERLLERELGASEGRLKASAAVNGMNGVSVGGKSVVSNFVRDILQDNANLQAGIVELRELLNSSNDEVQNLRDQIMQHQPIQDDNGGVAVSLDEQLGFSQSLPKKVPQEVHVHHHYHAKTGSKSQRSASSRRPSRKRALMYTALTPDSSIPSTPLVKPQRFMSSPIIPLSLQQPQPKNRWSMQSAATGSSYLSSMPSSPRSYFDRFDHGEESSRPTSPESAAGHSSPILWKRKLRTDDYSLSVFEEEALFEDGASPLNGHDNVGSTADKENLDPSIQVEQQEIDFEGPELTPKPSLMLDEAQAPDGLKVQIEQPQPGPESLHPQSSAICEASRVSEKKDQVHTDAEPLRELTETSRPYDLLANIPDIRPSLHRSASHDSLVSISGMDIHIAKRPSPASTLTLLRGNSYHFAHSPSQARKISASQPLASVTEYTAVSRPGLENHHRTSINALSGLANAGQSPQNKSPQTTSGGFGRLVGGWVRGKWGVAPTKSIGDMRSVSASQVPTIPPPPPPPPLVKSTSAQTTVQRHNSTDEISISTATSSQKSNSQSVDIIPPWLLGRAPGINQPGAIPGFALLGKRPSAEVQPKVVNIDVLKESLAE